MGWVIRIIDNDDFVESRHGYNTNDSVSVDSESSGETVVEYQSMSMMIWQVGRRLLVFLYKALCPQCCDYAVAAAAAVFFYDCFDGRLNSILLEDSFPKGVKLLCIVVFVVLFLLWLLCGSKFQFLV